MLAAGAPAKSSRVTNLDKSTVVGKSFTYESARAECNKAG